MTLGVVQGLVPLSRSIIWLKKGGGILPFADGGKTAAGIASVFD
jgi:hypothetical protein